MRTNQVGKMVRKEGVVRMESVDCVQDSIGHFVCQHGALWRGSQGNIPWMGDTEEDREVTKQTGYWSLHSQEAWLPRNPDMGIGSRGGCTQGVPFEGVSPITRGKITDAGTRNPEHPEAVVWMTESRTHWMSSGRMLQGEKCTAGVSCSPGSAGRHTSSLPLPFLYLRPTQLCVGSYSSFQVKGRNRWYQGEHD